MGSMSQANVGDLFHVAVPEDVRQLQASIRQELTGLTAAVASCSTLDAQTKVEWEAMRTRAQGYVDMEPSLWSAPTQISAGSTILRDLGAWHDRLKACGVGPALSNPAVMNQPQQGFFAGVNVEDLVKFAVLLALGYYGFKLLK